MKKLLLILIFTLSSSLWAEPFTLLKTEVIPAPKSALRQIPLQLVVEQGSRWDNRPFLQETLRKTQTILSQCGLSVGAVELRTVRLNPKTVNYANNPPSTHVSNFSPFMEGNLSALRPVMFLTGSRLNDTAKAFNLETVERYNIPGFESYHPLLNASFITESHADNSHVPGKPKASYSNFAHELVHILGNLPHTDANPNLLTDESKNGSKSGDLTPSQCLAMQGWPYDQLSCK